jgi:hypothetical protein
MFYVKLAYAVATAIILLYFFYVIFTFRKSTKNLDHMKDRAKKTPVKSTR